MDSVVIIDNLPLVDTAKRDKLLGVIKRIFKNIGNIVEEGGLYMPMGEDGNSKGWVVSRARNERSEERARMRMEKEKGSKRSESERSEGKESERSSLDPSGAGLSLSLANSEVLFLSRQRGCSTPAKPGPLSLLFLFCSFDLKNKTDESLFLVLSFSSLSFLARSRSNASVSNVSQRCSYPTHWKLARDSRKPKPSLSLGSWCSFLFAEFETPEEATNAVKQGDGYRLDKTHVLSVMHFKDVEKFANLPDEFSQPPEEPFKEKEHMKSWLMDPRGRDQFAVMRGEETAIFWNSKPEEELVYTRSNWTESYVQWSPFGTYLATFHRQGVALWGGPSWERLSRFAHPGVKLVDFSPKETYLITWSPEPVLTSEGDNHVSWESGGMRLPGVGF